MRKDEILKKIKKEILKCFDEIGIKMSQIILFGSRGKGNYNDLSDYDLLVIIENKVDLSIKKNIQRLIYNRLHKLFPITSFDIIIKTKQEFEDEKSVVNTISNEGVLEGITL